MRNIKAARGETLSCKGWRQESILRMLQNNLENAEKPQELIIYGGTGKAARDWECFDAIIESLRELENDETLLLVGESGVGKSKLIYYLAQETNTPLLNACGHSEITVENLLGTMTVVNGNTVWRDGILPETMRNGY